MATLAIIMITGFFLGTVFDLNISKALTGFSEGETPSIKVGFIPRLLEIIGYWTTPLFGAIALAVVETDMRKKLNEKGRLGFFCFATLADLGLMFYASYKMLKIIVGKLYIGHYIAIAIISIILAFLIRFVLEHIDRKKLEKVFKPALFTVFAIVAAIAVLEIIKITFGRVRFRDLVAAGDLDAYTPWYIPRWFSGSKSFPSGHVGNATVLMMLPLWFGENASKRKKTAAYTVVIIWIFVMAISRIFAGAHFLTDVIFGFMLGMIIVNVVYRFYRKAGKTEKPSGADPKIA